MTVRQKQDQAGVPAPPSLGAWARFIGAFLLFSTLAGVFAAAAAGQGMTPTAALAIGFGMTYALFAAGAYLFARGRPGFRWAWWATGVALFSAVSFGIAILLR